MPVLRRLAAAALRLAAASFALPADLSPARSSASGGCGKAPGVALDTRIAASLPSGRTYLYWVPPSYDPRTPAPLILSFHGATKTPAAQADLDLLTTPFFHRAGAVVAYPASGAYGANGTGRYWQGAPHVPADVDDVGFALDVLDALSARLCVDAERVYATGKSQGGLMANNLACDPRSSARLAAFAPVSGSYYVNVTGAACAPTTLAFDCHPARAHVPLLIFHGGADQTINFTGGAHNGECVPDIPHFVEAWAVRDGLGDARVREAPLGGAGDNATLYRYGAGALEDLVAFVYDGDHVNHQWPATIANADSIEYSSPPATFNASSMILDFFGRYTLSGRVNGTGHSSLWGGKGLRKQS
ncbi:Alpha/Beta hydrolase protein [Hypoxylon argillaceum]|nr:Alpha/Beta hydrolase protein [Hypoxylon argillaceum]